MNNFIVPKRGHSIGGLVRYLLGPGSANEHRDQRIIAADDVLDLDDGARLDRPEDWPQVLELGRYMDSHRRLFGVSPPDGHVWHCAISLPPGEAISDAQWAHVARAAMDAMGFTASSGKAPCRWIAVHHGQSAGGNEHIHLAVNLVREDGTTATTWRDRVTMSRLCARFEREFGLHVVEGRPGRGMPGYSRAEAERTRRGHRPEPDRQTLARTIRACATAAASEDEFVRRVNDAGVLARPRYAAGGRSEVTGYSVALRPNDRDGAPVWFGGGRLAADLTLPRLRQHWATMAPHLDRAAVTEQALAEWRHSADVGRPAARATVEETRSYPASTWDQAADRIYALCEGLAAVPHTDTAAWSTAARQAAGVFAALSARLEQTPGPLAEAADALARSAQTQPGQPRNARHSGLADLRGVALVARQATIPRGRPDTWYVLLRQLLNLIRAISSMHEAQRQAHHAAELHRIARDRLAALEHDSRNAAARLAKTDFPHPSSPGAPVPTRLTTLGATLPRRPGPRRDGRGFGR